MEEKVVEKKGLSQDMWIAIGVAVALIVIVLGYLGYKKSKNN